MWERQNVVAVREKQELLTIDQKRARQRTIRDTANHARAKVIQQEEDKHPTSTHIPTHIQR
jgi:hypothetical protein